MAGNAKPKSMYYVGPGGLTFVASSVLILMAALYTQANLLFWSFGLLVGGLVCSMGMSWLMLRGLTVERVVPPHAVAGEPTAIRYQVTNHKRWIPVFNLVIAEAWSRRAWRAGRTRGAGGSGGSGGSGASGGLRGNSNTPLGDEAPRLRGQPHSWVLHVGPGQSVLAEAPCWPTRRGYLTFELIEVSSSFPFGMLGRRLTFVQPGELTVYPHLFRVHRRSLQSLFHHDPTTTRRVQAVGISEEFFGLREYRPGDRMRSIDWKRTARTGKLVARETSRPGVTRVMVLLDLRPLGADAAKPLPVPVPTAPRYDLLGRLKPQPPEPAPDPSHPWVDAERAISLAASLLADAYFQGLPIGLAVRGAGSETFRVHRSLPHRALILDALARLDLARPGSKEQEGLIHPTIIVRPRAAVAPPSAPKRGNGNAADAAPTVTSVAGNGSALAFNAGDLERHVVEIEGGANAWLTTPEVKTRHQGREKSAWR